MYSPLSIFGNFLLLTVVSLSIGVAFAIFGCLIFKYIRSLSENPSSEILITFLVCYSSYIVSEMCNMSGVISLLISGILM